MQQADFANEAMWAEAAAANDALEALARAKLLARRRLAVHQRKGASGGEPARRIVAIGSSGVLYIGDTAGDGRTPHGEGTLILADGSQHVGRFDRGRAHGAGMWQARSGAAAVGEWVGNKRVGPFAAVDPSGGVFAEHYADNGRCVHRERRGAPNPPAACQRCGARFLLELDHAYACRRHRADFAPIQPEPEAEAAGAQARCGPAEQHAGAGAGCYRRLLTPAQLARRPSQKGGELGSGQPRAGLVHTEARAGDAGIWPCCGQHGRRAPGCVFETHRESATQLGGAVGAHGAPLSERRQNESKGRAAASLRR